MRHPTDTRPILRAVPAVRTSDDASPRTAWIASVAIHVVLIGVLPFLLAGFRGTEQPARIDVVFYKRPAEPRDPPPPVVPEPEQAVAVAEPPPPPPPKREAVKEPKPQPAPRPVQEVAKVQPRPEPPRPKPKPRPAIRTDTFAEPHTASVAMRAPRHETRSAGFGAPETTPSASRLRGSPRVGGFAVDPSPPEETTAAARRDRSVSTAGFGETASPPPTGTTTRDRAIVQTASFEDSDDGGPPQGNGASSATVSTGGFGDDAAQARPRPTRKKETESAVTPVEIVSKAKPVYTTAARENKVEGEVVLRVTFAASGDVLVLGILEGLGHGLDEAAMEAARKIKFKPARRDGQAVDHTAVLRIVFQLA